MMFLLNHLEETSLIQNKKIEINFQLILFHGRMQMIMLIGSPSKLELSTDYQVNLNGNIQLQLEKNQHSGGAMTRSQRKHIVKHANHHLIHLNQLIQVALNPIYLELTIQQVTLANGLQIVGTKHTKMRQRREKYGLVEIVA